MCLLVTCVCNVNILIYLMRLSNLFCVSSRRKIISNYSPKLHGNWAEKNRLKLKWNKSTALNFNYSTNGSCGTAVTKLFWRNPVLLQQLRWSGWEREPSCTWKLMHSAWEGNKVLKLSCWFSLFIHGFQLEQKFQRSSSIIDRFFLSLNEERWQAQ